VVTFLQPTAGGDIFSDEFPVADGFLVTLSFDYLGLEVDGSEPGNFGGFIGYADDTIPSFGLGRWLAGTDGTSGADPILIDDGAWHSYRISFDPYDETPPPANNVLRIIVEDFHAPPGDVFFDNIVVRTEQTVEVHPTSWGRIKASYR